MKLCILMNKLHRFSREMVLVCTYGHRCHDGLTRHCRRCRTSQIHCLHRRFDLAMIMDRMNITMVAGFAGRCNSRGYQKAKCEIVRNGWPSDDSILDTADTIVIYSDGGGGPSLAPFARLQKQIDRGAGFVCIHYAVEVLKENTAIASNNVWEDTSSLIGRESALDRGIQIAT